MNCKDAFRIQSLKKALFMQNVKVVHIRCMIQLEMKL